MSNGGQFRQPDRTPFLRLTPAFGLRSQRIRSGCLLSCELTAGSGQWHRMPQMKMHLCFQVLRGVRSAFTNTHPLRSFCSKISPTPDFNTSVEIHTHQLRVRRAEKLKEVARFTEGSLIPASLQHTEENEEHIETARQLQEMGQEKLTSEERKKRRRALDSLGAPNFKDFLAQRSIFLFKKPLSILQVSLSC